MSREGSRNSAPKSRCRSSDTTIASWPVENSGCHMRVPVAVVANLMRAEDIHICDNCGRYLHLASETENPFLDHLEEARVAEKEKPRKRKVAAHAL